VGFLGDDGTELPEHAIERLRDLRGEDLFTSTLSVEEFSLLGYLGHKPLAQVLGASVHQVGWQYLPRHAAWGGNVFCPLYTVSDAWDSARKNAFGRLREEAAQAGADTVVGVRLKLGEHDWARKTVDYVVVGTGIRTEAARGDAGSPSSPVLSDLSVQDYWKLRSIGWEPAGLVASTAVFFIAQSIGLKWRRRMRALRNQELTEYSRGFSAARTAAVRSLSGQAQTVGATGIVGVRLAHTVKKEHLKVTPAMAQGGGPYAQVGGTYSSGSVVISGAGTASGRDSRDGLVVTIQIAGTAIRRSRVATAPVPRMVVMAGASR
jgi:uncharacterized protein YbjQ (UPF0145 family)